MLWREWLGGLKIWDVKIGESTFDSEKWCCGDLKKGLCFGGGGGWGVEKDDTGVRDSEKNCR